MISFFRKRFAIIFPLLICCIAYFTWIYAIKPIAIDLIKNRLPSFNSSQEFVEISFADLDLSILTLQAHIHDLKVSFKQDKNKLSPLLIKRVDAQLDLFNLIIGVPKLNKIQLEGLEADFTIPVSKSKEQLPLIPVNKIFEIANLVPVTHLLINNSKINLNFEFLDEALMLSINSLKLSNNKNNIELATRQLRVETISANKTPLMATVDFSLAAETDLLNLENFSIKIRESELETSGKFINYTHLLRSPEGNIDTLSKFDLQDVRDILLLIYPQKERLPSASGKINLNGKMKFKSADIISGEINAKTSQVIIDHFKLGQAELKASIRENQITINQVGLEHIAGSILFKNLKIEQKSPYKFSANAEFKNFDLQKLFISMAQNDIPAGLVANGFANCEGLGLNLIVSCKLNTAIENVWVKSAKNSESYIVKLKKGQIKSDIKINSENIDFASTIELGSKSFGSAKGQVNFKTGFNIDFESDYLDFADVENLAGLNLKGVLKIIGNTSGNSSKGIIDANISASDSEIENFRLGSFSSVLSYRAGNLNFENILAVIGKSELFGNLKFNFNDLSLSSQISSNSFWGDDLIFILQKRFNLNFDFFGKGNLKADVSGPFDFWRLKYNLTSELQQGVISGERFEKLYVNLSSDGKRINFKDVRLQKVKSNLIIGGSILTESKKPEFDLKLRLSPLQLEESDHVLKYISSISGTGYSDGEVTGPIDNPTLTTNVTLKQIAYDKIEYPNSQGRLTVNKNNFSFNGQFFGRQVQTDLVWPWDPNQPFYAKILVRDLNPLFLLPLISIPQPSSDFYSRLNGEMDLSGRSRSVSGANGYIKISDFIIQRGNQFLKIEEPVSIFFKNGLKQMEQVNMLGDDSYLKLRLDSNLNSNKVKMNVDADLQLRLFHFLVPFTQSLSGKLVVNSQFIFKENGFELLGEGEISDGQIGLKGFPQTIENIHAPIEFSKSKIIFNDITAKIGNSDISGLGQIEIAGPQRIVVNLKALADSVQLEFPKKVMTQGRADLLFSGTWLPYNLKVDYKVNQGLVESDFESDSSQASNLKASSFLPPQQIQMLTPSLTLDIKIDAEKGMLVKNKLLEGEAKGNLQIQGTPEVPVISGKINITPGSKLVFKDKPFEIQTAAIQFQGTKEINPDLYISAAARVSDYDINLLVQGPAKNLNIKPTSQPPLSTNDIFTLLAFGVTNQGNQNLSSDTQQRQTGLEVLAAISNQSQLNKRIQEKLGLTLQLAPSVDSTKNIAVPKVVVSKKISKKINASYSKPFTGNDQNQEIKLQYLYNNNVSFQLNYQNIDTGDQEQITNNSNTNKSILGLDLEYRDEFK